MSEKNRERLQLNTTGWLLCGKEPDIDGRNELYEMVTKP